MVQGSKTQKIILDSHGSYLGMEKGAFTVKDKEGNIQRFPLFEKEIGEVILKSGNMVSTGALASLGFWDVDVLIMTQRGRPVAMLKALDDDSHVKTRVCQYEALKSGKGLEIAKKLVLAKIQGQNQVLKKYGLRQLDFSMIERVKNLELESLNRLRRKLSTYEGHCSNAYFQQVFSLFSEGLRPENRRTFKAYDGLNNLFNLGYELLSWKVHKALINAKLEPFLGFLHSEQFNKPSLVCDLMELYRFLVDDFLIQRFSGLSKKDFVTKYEVLTRKKIGKREYLNDVDSKGLMRELNGFFESNVEIARMKVGKRQTLETLISEEALLLAKYLRDERKDWNPRIPTI
ncbi:CRISPR-associated endonuclease Cas1 [Candidatus Bathyarchaeota archaeon A05DMB-2]|jgi:CRISPR-associated protein Cas1|nr:CRISPR-associated endonuclease Cas1 [Candidatus Bathyarchaeota archaeon A05DMB-2]